MNKRFKQLDIQHRENCDTKRANAWIKSQGLAAENFTELDLKLLQAQRIAHNCLKQHGDLLGTNEAKVLNNFLQALQNNKKRSRLTPAQAFKIMNIGNSVNRKLFQQHRQSNKQIKAKSSR
jgi:hypothetical protein